MADLLYVSDNDLKFIHRPDVIKAFNELCESLLLRPLFSSRMRGSWNRNEVRKLGKKESKAEVGWLWKNINEDNMSRLSRLTHDQLTHDYYNCHQYVEYVKEERRKRGLDRVSRMRSSYEPISLTKDIL